LEQDAETSGCFSHPFRASGAAGRWIIENPKRLAPGRSSFSTSILFASSSVARMLTPVMLPAGFDRLATSPAPTRSSPITTIGSVFVCGLSRPTRCVLGGKDHSSAIAHEGFGETGKAFQPTLSYPDVDTNILAVDEAMLRQGISQ